MSFALVDSGNVLGETFHERLAKYVHENAAVAWDRDAVFATNTTYYSLHLELKGDHPHPARVFVGHIDDYESWYEWNGSGWIFGHADKTYTQIGIDREKEHAEILASNGVCFCNECWNWVKYGRSQSVPGVPSAA